MHVLEDLKKSDNSGFKWPILIYWNRTKLVLAQIHTGSLFRLETPLLMAVFWQIIEKLREPLQH